MIPLPGVHDGYEPIAKGVMARVQIYGPQVEQIMNAFGIGGYYLVSDWSSVSDFGLSREELAEASEALGILIGRDEFIADVAERLACM